MVCLQICYCFHLVSISSPFLPHRTVRKTHIWMLRRWNRSKFCSIASLRSFHAFDVKLQGTLRVLQRCRHYIDYGAPGGSHCNYIHTFRFKSLIVLIKRLNVLMYYFAWFFFAINLRNFTHHFCSYSLCTRIGKWIFIYNDTTQFPMYNYEDFVKISVWYVCT
jgi:hypothetical protein